MATDLGQAKAPPTARYETFVRSQLAKAETRIRTLDLTASLLLFAGATLVFAVVAALFDRWLDPSAGVRQAACVLYLLAAAAYLAVFVFRPLSRRINPYFAARQLERTLPGAKNSVVNWLDLHEENLPAAIRGAVGQRAARDLADADVEKAVSGRRAYSAAGIAALCALAFAVALFTLGPGLFFGHLLRAVNPFSTSDPNSLPTSTRLTLVKPEAGDAVVPDDRPVDILVRVAGRVPDAKAADALKLLFRYQQDAPYQQRLLESDDSGRWGATLLPVDVQDGFWYKVAGGDAETPEYRVRLTARVQDFKAVYQFRPYLARTNEMRTERKIEALRGTRVDVTVHTNRDVKDGHLQLENTQGVAVVQGERLPDDPQGFTVHMTLDDSYTYRIAFTSVDGENFVEPQGFPLIAVPDRAPVVTLTQPAELKEKPGWVSPLQADAILSLEGNATDDTGVKAMRLMLQVENGPTLPFQEYRTAKDFQLAHGGNPTSVDYKDFVDLAKLRSPADPAFVVRPGMVLEYWLTAEDACDYTKANVGESKHYRVQIAEPLNNVRVQKQQRTNAEKQKQDNDQKQDDKNKQEDAKRQEENQKKGGKGDPNKGQQGNNPKDNTDKQPGMGETNPDTKPKDGDTGNNTNPDPQNSGAKKPGDVSNNLDQALKDQKQDQEGTGKNDPRQQPAGDGKAGGQQDKQPKPADSKEGGSPEEKKDAGQPKDQPSGQHDEGMSKEGGKPDPSQPQQGESKAGDPKAQPGEGKEGEPVAAPQQQPGASKEGGKPDAQQGAASEKPQPDGMGNDKAPQAEKKDGTQPNGTADAQPAGAGKDKAAPENKSEAKSAGPQNSDPNGEKSTAKADGTQTPMGDKKPAGEAKSGGEKTDKQDVASGKSEDKPLTDEEKRENLEKAVKKLEEALKSKDPQQRQMAEEFIKRYMQNSEDPKVREAGEKALADAGLNKDDVKVADGKPEEPPSDSGKPPTAPKENPAEKKPGTGSAPSTEAKETPPEKPTDDVTKGDSKGDGKAPDKTNPMTGQKEPSQPPAVAKGGPGNGAQKRDGDLPPGDPHSPPPAPETPVEQRASVLQLRKFLETVPKDVLKDAQHDPAAWKKLQEEAAKWLAQHPPENGKDLAGPQQGGSLNNTIGKTSDPNVKPPIDDPNTGGRALPPPGYRDTVKEFTKLLSQDGDK